ncbi:MAG: hypothetical protein ACKVZJ_01090 [Phycisphaerales bacterium]
MTPAEIDRGGLTDQNREREHAARVISRRKALGAIAAGTAGGVLAGGAILGTASCSRGPARAANEMVLYSSVDDVFLRPIIARAERELGLKVLIKGDTEATKTTGLVERLRAEHAAGTGGADVWWSSEPFLTIALADEGVFVPMRDDVFGDLPKEHRGEGNLWGCFAERARVIVTPESQRYHIDNAPVGLLSDRFIRSRPAIARASFGTTRGHFAAVLAHIGEERYLTWLRSLQTFGMILVDGNSAVVRTVASGATGVGLTDTDDVWSGQREGWPVTCMPALIDGWGPLMIPNTAALVKGGANPKGAAALARFIMSEAVERALMESDSHNMPVRAALLAEMRSGPLKKFVVGLGESPRVSPTLREIADAAPRAVELARAEGLA